MSAKAAGGTEIEGTDASPIEIRLDSEAASSAGASRKNPRLLAQIIKLLKKGNRLSSKGDYAAALPLHLKAWELDYENTDSIKCLAHTLGQLGERAKAIRLFEILLELNPDDPEIAGLLGQLAIDLEMWEQAVSLNRIFIQMKPENETGYANLATALRHLERFDEVVAFMQDILPMFPESAALWNVLASAVNFRDGLEAALPFYEEALRLNPNFWQALNNLGRAYNAVGDFEKVIEYCERANAIKSTEPQSHIGLAFGYLGVGRLEEGWKEYEWRQHRLRNSAIRWTHGLPVWEGQDLTGKSILVCPEQGVGDEILFASCVPDLMGEADRVYLGCDKRLVTLFERSFPAASEVGSFRDISSDAFRYRDLPWVRELDEAPDFFIPAASLNKFYRNRVEDFPTPGGGYLVPDPSRVAFWKERLANQGRGLKVGICWRSGLRSAERNIWYADLEDWAPIFAVEGVSFVNLQYGDCADELGYIEDRFGVTVLDWDDIDLKDDLDETAALTKACDLVVTIGAAPGMTAMAVDMPILWMFPFYPWWVYGQAPGTPLHGRSLIMTAETIGDWRSVTEPVAKRIARIAEDPSRLEHFPN